MASKRMFDRAILETDSFMDLSMSGKALYFLLGMEADDEGFVSPRRVMRTYGGNDDDLRILIAKKFVIPFESGVVVITDWKQNNYLDSNRIKATQYQKEKKMLVLTEQNKYELNKCLTSIEESSIEQKNIEEIAGASPAEWVLEDKLSSMEREPNSYLDVIATFIREKPVKIENSAQLSNVISRYCRVAKKLAGAYTNQQIFEAVEQIKKDNVKRKFKGDEVDYTLETVYKYLTK